MQVDAEMHDPDDCSCHPQQWFLLMPRNFLLTVHKEYEKVEKNYIIKAIN